MNAGHKGIHTFSLLNSTEKNEAEKKTAKNDISVYHLNKNRHKAMLYYTKVQKPIESLEGEEDVDKFRYSKV